MKLYSLIIRIKKYQVKRGTYDIKETGSPLVHFKEAVIKRM